MVELMLLLAVFLAGAVAATLVLLCVGSGREDREATLRDVPPTRAAAVERRMMGLHVRMPQVSGSDATAITDCVSTCAPRADHLESCESNMHAGADREGRV